MLNSQIDNMAEMIALGYTTAQSVPSFENGYLKSVAREDIGTAKARETCTDDPIGRSP
jgi:hypothetical protein